jgi:hypothetical protein
MLAAQVTQAEVYLNPVHTFEATDMNPPTLPNCYSLNVQCTEADTEQLDKHSVSEYACGWIFACPNLKVMTAWYPIWEHFKAYNRISGLVELHLTEATFSDPRCHGIVYNFKEGTGVHVFKSTSSDLPRPNVMLFGDFLSTEETEEITHSVLQDELKNLERLTLTCAPGGFLGDDLKVESLDYTVKCSELCGVSAVDALSVLAVAIQERLFNLKNVFLEVYVEEEGSKEASHVGGGQQLVDTCRRHGIELTEILRRKPNSNKGSNQVL